MPPMLEQMQLMNQYFSPGSVEDSLRVLAALGSTNGSAGTVPSANCSPGSILNSPFASSAGHSKVNPYCFHSIGISSSIKKNAGLLIPIESHFVSCLSCWATLQRIPVLQLSRILIARYVTRIFAIATFFEHISGKNMAFHFRAKTRHLNAM